MGGCDAFWLGTKEHVTFMNHLSEKVGGAYIAVHLFSYHSPSCEENVVCERQGVPHNRKVSAIRDLDFRTYCLTS